jgi:hypothetical protein
MWVRVEKLAAAKTPVAVRLCEHPAPFCGGVIQPPQAFFCRVIPRIHWFLRFARNAGAAVGATQSYRARRAILEQKMRGIYLLGCTRTACCQELTSSWPRACAGPSPASQYLPTNMTLARPWGSPPPLQVRLECRAVFWETWKSLVVVPSPAPISAQRRRAKPGLVDVCQWARSVRKAYAAERVKTEVFAARRHPAAAVAI